MQISILSTSTHHKRREIFHVFQSYNIIRETYSLENNYLKKKIPKNILNRNEIVGIEYKKKMYCFYVSYEKKFFKISKEKKKRKRNLEI